MASALLLALFASSAHASFDPLGGGTTKLTLDPTFARFLKDDGITLSGAQGAKRKGSTYALPISGGTLDPTEGKGEIEDTGSLVFKSERKKVPLREITIKTAHSPLVAKVGGSQLKVASSGKLSFQREGFDSSFTASKLKLSAKVVTRLNKKLRPDVPFKAGALLGTLTAKAKPKLTAIGAVGKATLLYDPGFVKKLDQRFVSLNPIFPAEHQGATFTYPIAAGALLAPDASEGELRTNGTTELLQLHAGQVFWKELWFDLGQRQATAEVDVEPSPSFPGKLGRVGVFSIGQGGVVASDPKARTISVQGAPLSLSANAAATLNEAFAQGEAAVFTAGEAVGQVSFTAQGQ